MFLQRYYEIKAKKNTACQSPHNNHIISYCILLYINHLPLLLLLTLSLVAKSFSSSYKELPSATSNNSRGINERRKQQQNPLATLLSLFQALCVSHPDNNDQRLRQTTTYHVILSSTIVFAADGRYTNSN